MEKNELSQNAMGGTELMMNRIHSSVSSDLLDKVQIIPSRVRDIDPDKKTILYLHDLPGDPEVQHLKDGGWAKFDKLVFVSHWQQLMYNLILGVPYHAGTVLRNAITPIEEHLKPSDGTIRLIYTSTPHRGLVILYPVFKALCKQFSNIELEVFSSFALYGWAQRDEPYKELIAEMEADPKVVYHGAKSNDEVREGLKRSHIFAYPSIWQETSCLCLIEAMSAGCLSVHSSLAALPETSLSITNMYGYTENHNDHAQILYNHLASAINQCVANRMTLQHNTDYLRPLVNAIYDWNTRKNDWERLISNMSQSDKYVSFPEK